MTNYQRGKRLELQARDVLRHNGYVVILSTGSKTAVDLLAVKRGEILLVQCKAHPRGLPVAEWNELLTLARQAGGTALLVDRPTPRTTRWVEITTPRQPRQRTTGLCREWTPDPGLNEETA